MPPQAFIRPRHDLPNAEIDRLEDRLYDHNRHAIGQHDGRGLGFVAIDPDGAVVATVAGYSWAGMVELRQLWVEESHRGVGLGRALVEAAVTEAGARGCQTVWVMSHSFQAPGLYERCGFERIAELTGWPPGHAKVVLRRLLAHRS